MNPDELAATNGYTDRLYSSQEFQNGQGRYFNVTFDDQNGGEAEVQTSDRYRVTLMYLKNSEGKIKEIKFKRYKKQGSEWRDAGQEITFNNFSATKLIEYLRFFSQLDLGSLGWGRFNLSQSRDTGIAGIDAAQTSQLKTLLQTDDGKKIIEELLNQDGIVTHNDVVSIGFRRKGLVKFREFLDDEDKLILYGNEHGLPIDKPEKIWQHFFDNNRWIFGYGLDYRFLGILQREAEVGESDTGGRDGSITDFLLGCKDFTVLVEIKKPSTSLFVDSRTAAGVQRISNDLVRSISQILGQKADWQVRSTHGRNFDDQGNEIIQKTVDPKCLLIIGRSTEYRATDRDSRVKARTFEMFRRDSRNIDIVTYDELYERAEFIVSEHQQSQQEIGDQQ